MERKIYSNTRNCAGCRYWSEMLAQSGGGFVSAVCLEKKSPNFGKHTGAFQHCNAWQSGHLGAIDDPAQDPTRYTTETAE